jgi:FOG: FHA domain
MNTEPKAGYLCRIAFDGTPLECWRTTDRPLVVGRGDLVEAFVEDDSLSRSHFMIDRENTDFILVDLESSNGTQVNGKSVASHRLTQYDIIEAGASRFCFFLNPPELARVPVELFEHLHATQPRSSV